jgi:putative transcriptional regulator
MNESLQGHFLVASPHLPDPNFYRTVVLMVQHDDEGAFGFVLNRPSPRTVGDVWEIVSGVPCRGEQPVMVGGPVEGPLMALHTLEEYAEKHILEDVFLAAQEESIDRLIRDEEGPVLLLSGYAGWGAGQLESELEVGGWLVAPASRSLIFADQDLLWKRVAEQIGMEILRPALKHTPVPDDPTWN